MLTMADGGFFPEGSLNDVMEFCVEGMTSMSTEEQQASITWGYLENDGVNSLEPESCTLNCAIPPDACAELVNPSLSCDNNGVYHYTFSIRNVNERMLDASIAVLGPIGSTTPDDFSQATFPTFPDHTPNGAPFLLYNETTEVFDITLPNAVLGSNIEFIISLHDYRNINPEDEDYWCCYTPISFDIPIDAPCIQGLTIEDPLAYDLFPNPTKAFFSVTFDTPLGTEAELILLDINGEVKSKTNLESGTESHTLNVADFPTGIYFVSVFDNDGNEYHQRFLKQ